MSSDPILQAAADALRPCTCVKESAAEIVNAIRPLIEAEVLERHGVGAFEEFEYDLREQIARDIEALPVSGSEGSTWWVRGERYGIATAARVARRGRGNDE